MNSHNTPQEMLSISLLSFPLVSLYHFIILRTQSCELILKDEQLLWSADTSVWTWQGLSFVGASCI